MKPTLPVVFVLVWLGLSVTVAPPVSAQQQEKKPVHPSLVKIEDDPRLPRVLLIGDSISMGYTVPVRERLKGKANVHRIPANGGPTSRGIANLDNWLGDGNWDLIHFNWGIHDLKHMPDGTRQVEPADYEENLRALVEKLGATGAHLVWASTTPIPDPPLKPERTFGDETEYNAIAAKVMTEHQVPINDLHAGISPRFSELHRPQDLHFTAEGSEALADLVAAEIEGAFESLAKARIRQLYTAIQTYFTEYRKFPTRDVGGDDSVGESNADLMNILTASKKETVRGGLNPRQIVFCSFPEARPAGEGRFRGGISESDEGDRLLWDPWGNLYRVVMDTNYDSRIPTPSWVEGGAVAIPQMVIVWSAGPDGLDETAEDNLVSW